MFFLFIESGSSRRLEAKFPVYQQRFHFFPLNIIERLVVFTIVRFKGYDNFYVHYSIFSAILASIVSRFSNAKTYYWYCQMYHLYPHRWWEKFAFRVNLKLISTLITGNQGMRDYFNQVFKVSYAKSVSFPLWINQSRFEFSQSAKARLKKSFGLTGSKVVLFVHGLSPRKGADKIIPVAKRVSQTVKNVVFLVVGDGEMLESLKEQVKREKLDSLVRIVGPVGNIDIPKYYALADVFYMPSKEEEFGRVLLETMAAGVPVVASDTLGPRAIMTPFQLKYLATYPDIDDYSKKISVILTSQEVHSRLRQDGIHISHEYRIDLISNRFTKLIGSRVDRQKVCFVVSTYDKNISSHYRHIYEFLEDAGKELDIHLFLENSLESKVDIKNMAGTYVQKLNSIIIINFLERLLVFLYLRLKGYRYFYVHYSIFSSIAASIICKLTSGTSLYWHCQTRHKYERKLELNWDSIYWKFTQDWSFRVNLMLISKLVTCTCEMADYYTKYFNILPGRTEHFPLWVNLDRFKIDRRLGGQLEKKYHLAGKKVVLFVHWLSERKGADKIIPVARMVVDKLPSTVFFVVGGGPLLNLLKDDTNKNGLSKNVIFTGATPNNEVPGFYNIADVFFMPILENGFGRVLLEAMAYKLPAVASNTLGPKELFKGLQGKYLVDPNKTAAFAEAIIKILSDRKLYKRLSKENWLLVKKYDLSIAVNNFTKLFY